MNAHQRRIDRRTPRMTIDLESWPLGDFFDRGPVLDLYYIRPRGERLSTPVTVLKARPAGSFTPSLSADFTSLENRIAAMNPGFALPYGFLEPIKMDSV